MSSRYPADNLKNLAKHLEKKANLKQDVYENTLKAFKMLKDEAQWVIKDLRTNMANKKRVIPLEYTSKGDFEFELKFAGDVLIFYMHSNVFEFPVYHEISKLPYVRADRKRAFCGVINIYNFLADSFKYNRINDVGLLIGRLFINDENHFFVEGRRELNQVSIEFAENKISISKVREVLRNAIWSTIDFDLQIPPYEFYSQVMVSDFQNEVDQLQLKTSKRLGFRSQNEKDKIF